MAYGFIGLASLYSWGPKYHQVLHLALREVEQLELAALARCSQGHDCRRLNGIGLAKHMSSV